MTIRPVARHTWLAQLLPLLERRCRVESEGYNVESEGYNVESEGYNITR
jgi:hypothetical protein